MCLVLSFKFLFILYQYIISYIYVLFKFLNVSIILHSNGNFVLFSLSFSPKLCKSKDLSRGCFDKSHSKIKIIFKYIIL